ncbi:MAG: tetratricopeptide repeat protein [Deltaproteobacteria bacterium]|nr:tetratricopeptide repeat protein [Deltaproteobacteria bacterium]MBI4794753.1 tetratricopeptide repeat protein [Deltaproteobacteria bacterium]
MIRTSVKITAIVLALILCAGGLAFAAKAKKAAKEMDVGQMLMTSFELMEKGKFPEAQKMLDKVLAKDPGNPLALNNMAAIMVKQNKFDKADTYLNQSLARAKGYMVQVNRVCQVRGICVAFKPAAGGSGNQELEPLVKMNIDMVKQYMSADPLAGKGPR